MKDIIDDTWEVFAYIVLVLPLAVSIATMMWLARKITGDR